MEFRDISATTSNFGCKDVGLGRIEAVTAAAGEEVVLGYLCVDRDH